MALRHQQRRFAEGDSCGSSNSHPALTHQQQAAAGGSRGSDTSSRRQLWQRRQQGAATASRPNAPAAAAAGDSCGSGVSRQQRQPPTLPHLRASAGRSGACERAAQTRGKRDGRRECKIGAGRRAAAQAPVSPKDHPQILTRSKVLVPLPSRSKQGLGGREKRGSVRGGNETPLHAPHHRHAASASSSAQPPPPASSAHPCYPASLHGARTHRRGTCGW